MVGPIPYVMLTIVRQSISLCLFKNVAFCPETALGRIRPIRNPKKSTTNGRFVAVFSG